MRGKTAKKVMCRAQNTVFGIKESASKKHQSCIKATLKKQQSCIKEASNNSHKTIKERKLKHGQIDQTYGESGKGITKWY